MKLLPLKQWICDVCGEIIESPKDGYVQFNRNKDGQYDDFIIVHHKTKSPRKHSANGCYKYSCDTDLTDFIGERGIIEALSLMDPGKYHMPTFKPFVSDIRKWLDFIRRLQIPHYEEARLYWDKAKCDGFIADANEIMIYTPRFLKSMIEKYEKDT